MEAIKQTVKIPKNHEIKIKVPESFPENGIVDVILILKKESKKFDKKIEDLRQSMKDKAFLDDLRDISEDFDLIDQEFLDNINEL